MEETQNAEVMELSLEKFIDTKLVQSNVTESVLAALKEKYGNLKLKSLDDKESYLEVKAAAKECAKVRTLTTKLCKEGRERAVKEQKLWIAKEKEIISKVAEVEDVLDAEADKYDAEVARKDAEEKERQESAYINRQASLSKMGATYIDGSFVLGEASFEASLIKGSSIDVWEDAVLPKFQAEYDKIESVRISEEKRKQDQEIEIKRQQQELAERERRVNEQMAEMQRQKDEADSLAREKAHAELLEKERVQHKLQTERFNALFQFNPTGADVNMQSLWVLSESDFNDTLTKKKYLFEKDQQERAELLKEKLLADIEFAKQDAIKKEQERVAEEARLAEVKTKEAEEKKQAEFDAMKDKAKWATFIELVGNIETFEMRSSQYRKKMQIAKEKLDEILGL